MLLLFGLILPWVLLAVSIWLHFHSFRQNGRMLLRLEAIEKSIADSHAELPARHGAGAVRAGLPVGTLAPDFALPDLGGQRRSLSQYRGSRIILLFFNPQCGFCVQMVPDLARWCRERTDVTTVVVSTGDRDENERLLRRNGVDCSVLLQDAMEVAAIFRVNGTPMGYRVDERGEIASDLATGADAVLALARSWPSRANRAVTESTHDVPHTALLPGLRPLSTSRLNREGLRAGTAAPGFVLPRVGGGEVSLDHYRGHRTLLVFSDPHCGPCDELAPTLEHASRQRRDLKVLMISRGDEATNAAKIAKYGLSFPVLLQRQWEVSRLYAMFATPVAYVIDGDGVLATDVLVGADPIHRTLKDLVVLEPHTESRPAAQTAFSG